MDVSAHVTLYNFLDEELSHSGYIYRNKDYRYHYKLEPNQVYYIKIIGGTENKTYIMDLDFIADNVGNTKTSGEEILLNKKYIWSIDGYSDYDFGYFTADKTGPYKFNFANTGVNGRVSTTIYNWNTDEKLYYDEWLNKSKILNLTAGQKVYFHVDSWSGSTGNYTLSVQNQTVEKITLNKPIIELNRGDNYQLVATISPNNAYDNTVSWSSNNSNIVRVDASGNLIANKPGQTLITCTVNDGSGTISTSHVIVKPGKVDNVYADLEKNTTKSVNLKWYAIDSISGYTVYGYDTKTKK